MSYVYAIRHPESGRIKIGSGKYQSRLRDARVWVPGAELVAVGPGGYEREIYLHEKLAPFRVAGEWFEPHPLVLTEVARLPEPWAGLPADGMSTLSVALPTWLYEAFLQRAGASQRGLMRAVVDCIGPFALGDVAPVGDDGALVAWARGVAEAFNADGPTEDHRREAVGRRMDLAVWWPELHEAITGESAPIEPKATAFVENRV